MKTKILFLSLAAACFIAQPAAAKPDKAAAKLPPAKTYEVTSVLVAPYSGVISPAAAEFIGSAIERLNAQGGPDLLVIELDTPGGLDASMRVIIKDMLASQKPVAIYVYPQGARAASAGVFIAAASPLVAMSPGTNIGAAHPVMLGGLPFSVPGGKDADKKQAKDPMEEKILNDSTAYMKSITQKTGRNTEWAIRAVTKSESIPAQEAVKNGMADFIAADLTEFLAKADGFKAGDFGVLKVQHPIVQSFLQNRRQKFLATVTNPDIAMILMSLGAAGLFIELYHPGLILPGVVGAVSMVTAFYAFQTLSANTAGIALILLGFVFFIVEIKVMSYGLLTLAGALSIFLGGIIMFNEPSLGGGVSVSMGMLLSTIIGLIAIVALLSFIVVKAQMRRVVTGIESLAGKKGVAKTALSPKGTVLVEGELWEAESVSGDIAQGAPVTVTAVEGFRVRVKHNA